MIRLKPTAVRSDALSWQRWSGPSRHGARSRGRTRRAWWECRFHFPRTRYPPKSRHRPSDRPGGRQSRPEEHTQHIGQQTQCEPQQHQASVFCHGGGGAHHAGGGSGGSGADHQIADLVAPETTTVVIGEQGEGGLLQQGGGVGSCQAQTRHTSNITDT